MFTSAGFGTSLDVSFLENTAIAIAWSSNSLFTSQWAFKNAIYEYVFIKKNPFGTLTCILYLYIESNAYGHIHCNCIRLSALDSTFRVKITPLVSLVDKNNPCL
jgi:hypothetical protein